MDAAGSRPAAGGHHVIALVGSAGGLDAVFRILGALPQDFPAALIVLIHQQPDRASHLKELIEARCALPVAEAADDEPLLPGVVAIVPPGKHLLVKPGLRTGLIASGPAPPSRPSADLLLATLATAAGSRAVAVVLSGGGHDGATGATAVHGLGGVVLATDEASSTVFSMPQATIQRDHVIDHVVGLDAMAARLVELVAEPPHTEAPPA